MALVVLLRGVNVGEGRDVARLISQEPFPSEPVRPDVVRFVSVLSQRPRSRLPMPVSFPSTGPWLLKILGRHDRFVFGVYRRQMKAVRYLGTLDGLFGVPVTTRNWNTIIEIARQLDHEGSARGPH